MQSDVLDRLSSLDPAPARELSSHEREIRAELLVTIMSASDEDGRAVPVRWPRRLRWTIASVATAIVVGALAAIIVPQLRTPSSVSEAFAAKGLSAASVQGWTSSPSPLPKNAPVVAFCEQTLAKPGPPSLSNGDLRGDVESVIVTVDGYAAWCLMGADGLGMYSLFSAPSYSSVPLAPGQLSLEGAAGAHGLTGAGFSARAGYAFAAGRAASDVVRVVLHESGRNVTASLDDGKWTAWWPVDDYERAAGDMASGSATVTTSSGAMVSYPFAELQGQ